MKLREKLERKMTLHEKLSEKVKEETKEEFITEIEKIFLRADLDELLNGYTVYIFSNDSNELSYSTDQSDPIGRKFKRNYDIIILEEVIPILNREGLEVEYHRHKNNLQATITYKP